MLLNTAKAEWVFDLIGVPQVRGSSPVRNSCRHFYHDHGSTLVGEFAAWV